MNEIQRLESINKNLEKGYVFPNKKSKKKAITKAGGQEE